MTSKDDNLKIGGVIGIGTYGEVRYALNIATSERCAVKIVDLARFSEETQMLMLKEIKILRMLKHENVIRILDVRESVPYTGHWCENCACTSLKRLPDGVCGHCNHQAYEHSAEETKDVMMIVQELAAGGELFGLLMHSGAFPEEVARLYFRQLISGLEHCHYKGIAHRDLKPENLVLAGGDFSLKIVDFGLAAIINSMDSQNVVLHSGVGSQPYSAPEVYYIKELFGGRGYSGPPADVWSCAVILFVMLTGRPPFVRPLAKTYGANLKRCRHFCNLMKGIGYEKMSVAAKEFLMKIFKLQPEDRLSIEKIKRDPWFNGPTPSREYMTKLMEQKAKQVWGTQDKMEMIDVLSKIRAEMTPIYAPQPSPSMNSLAGLIPSPLTSPALVPSHPHHMINTTHHADRGHLDSNLINTNILGTTPPLDLQHSLLGTSPPEESNMSMNMSTDNDTHMATNNESHVPYSRSLNDQHMDGAPADNDLSPHPIALLMHSSSDPANNNINYQLISHNNNRNNIDVPMQASVAQIFAETNINTSISLLSLHDQDNTPVYRSLTAHADDFHVSNNNASHASNPSKKMQLVSPSSASCPDSFDYSHHLDDWHGQTTPQPKKNELPLIRETETKRAESKTPDSNLTEAKQIDNNTSDDTTFRIEVHTPQPQAAAEKAVKTTSSNNIKAFDLHTLAYFPINSFTRIISNLLLSDILACLKAKLLANNLHFNVLFIDNNNNNNKETNATDTAAKSSNSSGAIAPSSIQTQYGDCFVRVCGTYDKKDIVCTITVLNLGTQNIIDFHKIKGDMIHFYQFFTAMTTGITEETTIQ